MSLSQFVKKNYALIGFAFGMSLAATFGQTFVISLFVPYLMTDFGLGRTEMGWIYGGATLVSALSLPWLGRHIDTMSLQKYTYGVTVGLVVACLAIATASHPAWLFLALYLLRLCGQGLMTHISSVSVLVGFEKYRGRASSIAFLGGPVGEATLPLVMTAIAVQVNWKLSWIAAAVAIVLTVPFLTFFGLKNGSRGDESMEIGGNAKARAAQSSVRLLKQWSRSEVLRDPLFWGMTVASILPPFVLTGLFLFQTQLAELRGWSLEWVAFCFLGLSSFRILGSFVSGWLVDRVTAIRWLPFTEIPLGFGLLCLAFWNDPYSYLTFGCLAGLTIGFIGPAKSAFWSEVYGVRHIGAIRSALVSAVVLSTAIAPVITGHILDWWSWSSILAVCGVAVLLSCGLIAVLSASFARRRIHEYELHETAFAPQ